MTVLETYSPLYECAGCHKEFNELVDPPIYELTRRSDELDKYHSDECHENAAEVPHA